MPTNIPIGNEEEMVQSENIYQRDEYVESLARGEILNVHGLLM